MLYRHIPAFILSFCVCEGLNLLTKPWAIGSSTEGVHNQMPNVSEEFVKDYNGKGEKDSHAERKLDRVSNASVLWENLMTSYAYCGDEVLEPVPIGREKRRPSH